MSQFSSRNLRFHKWSLCKFPMKNIIAAHRTKPFPVKSTIIVSHAALLLVGFTQSGTALGDLTHVNLSLTVGEHEWREHLSTQFDKPQSVASAASCKKRAWRARSRTFLSLSFRNLSSCVPVCPTAGAMIHDTSNVKLHSRPSFSIDECVLHSPRTKTSHLRKCTHLRHSLLFPCQLSIQLIHSPTVLSPQILRILRGPSSGTSRLRS